MILGTGGREIHGEAKSKIHTQLDSCVTEVEQAFSVFPGSWFEHELFNLGC